MPVLNRLLLGKYTLATDAVTEAAIKLASLRTANRLRKNLALELLMLNTFGQTLPLIFLDNPRAFNYGDDLMIRGSELLKYPQLYSHMGWFDTKNSPILADQYYKMGNNGFLDPTHFTEFTNSDTYTPIPEQYLLQILNQAFAANGRYGQERERNKLGSIEPKHKVIYQEPLTPLGTVPGADAAFADYSVHPTDLGADNLRSIYTTTGALPRAVAGMHPAGTAVFAPSMGYDAYNRLINAKSWKDYAIGTGEGLMTVASLIAPLSLAYKSLRGSLNPTYKLGVEMQRNLNTGLDWSGYYNYNPNTPHVYNTGISPKFNATTNVVTTSLGKVRYSPEHLSKHFDLPINDEFVRDLTENAVTRGKYSFSLSDFKGKDNISLIYPNSKGTLFTPSRILVPELFPNLNFSFSNDLEDYSSLGYAFGLRNYTWFKKDDGTFIRVPNPLQRVTTISDVDTKGAYPLQLFFNGKPYVKEGLTGSGFRLVEDPDADFNLSTAYPVTPLIPKGIKNISYVYNGIDAPSYLEFANRFPDVVWNPSNMTPKGGTVFSRWDNTINNMIQDINSPEFIQHLKSELGSNVDELFIRRTLTRRLTGTIPFERNVAYGDFPVSGSGPFTFEGKYGIGPDDANFFGRLLREGKISPKYKTEEEFLESLSTEERLAYNRAKAGETKILGAELPGGDWGSLFNTETEEGYHLWDIGNNYTPWMKKIDEHNDELLKLLLPVVNLLGGRESLPRFRWAQNIYRDLESDLLNFYTGKSRFEIPQLFYRDFLKKDSRLYKAFPELEEYSKERFFFELNNAYKKNNAFFNILEHIVQNDVPQSNNISIT